MKPFHYTMAWMCPSLSKIVFVLLTLNKVTGRCKTKGTCPDLWSQWENHCYKLTDGTRSWNVARDYCVDLGGVMVAPHSREEENYLLGLTAGGELWINCNDITSEGTWECKEGTTTVDYTRWASLPDDNGGEDCAGLLPQGWNDIKCSWERTSVCKQPIPTIWV